MFIGAVGGKGFVEIGANIETSILCELLMLHKYILHRGQGIDVDRRVEHNRPACTTSRGSGNGKW